MILLSDWSSSLTFIQNYGIGLVVIGVIIFFTVSYINKVFMPTLVARSKMKLEEEQKASNLKIQDQEAKFKHEQDIRETQLKEQTVKLELANQMVETTKGFSEHIKEVSSILSSVNQSIGEHTKDLSNIAVIQKGLIGEVQELNEQHKDWEAGLSFETMVLKEKALLELELKHKKGEWTDDEFQKLKEVLEKGL